MNNTTGTAITPRTPWYDVPPEKPPSPSHAEVMMHFMSAMIGADWNADVMTHDELAAQASKAADAYMKALK